MNPSSFSTSRIDEKVSFIEWIQRFKRTSSKKPPLVMRNPLNIDIEEGFLDIILLAIKKENMKFTLKLLRFLLLFVASFSVYANKAQYKDMSIDELQIKASEIHPSGIYMLAGKLLNKGKNNDAVFWFYVGQIRFRAHLLANPNLEPSGDPALFNSLNSVLGQPINEYAGGDPDEWVKLIHKAKEWDASNSNKVTPKEKHTVVYSNVLKGLDQMVIQIENNKEQLRRQRESIGLENR